MSEKQFYIAMVVLVMVIIVLVYLIFTVPKPTVCTLPHPTANDILDCQATRQVATAEAK